MCKPIKVQVVMTGHSISVATITGEFLITWEVNSRFKHDYVINYLLYSDFEPSDVSYAVFPWLEVLRDKPKCYGDYVITPNCDTCKVHRGCSRVAQKRHDEELKS